MDSSANIGKPGRTELPVVQFSDSHVLVLFTPPPTSFCVIAFTPTFGEAQHGVRLVLDAGITARGSLASCHAMNDVDDL